MIHWSQPPSSFCRNNARKTDDGEERILNVERHDSQGRRNKRRRESLKLRYTQQCNRQTLLTSDPRLRSNIIIFITSPFRGHNQRAAPSRTARGGVRSSSTATRFRSNGVFVKKCSRTRLCVHHSSAGEMLTISATRLAVTVHANQSIFLCRAKTLCRTDGKSIYRRCLLRLWNEPIIHSATQSATLFRSIGTPNRRKIRNLNHRHSWATIKEIESKEICWTECSIYFNIFQC